MHSNHFYTFDFKEAYTVVFYPLITFFDNIYFTKWIVNLDKRLFEETRSWGRYIVNSVLLNGVYMFNIFKSVHKYKVFDDNTNDLMHRE